MSSFNQQQVCNLYNDLNTVYPGQIYQPSFCNTKENFGLNDSCCVYNNRNNRLDNTNSFYCNTLYNPTHISGLKCKDVGCCTFSDRTKIDTGLNYCKHLKGSYSTDKCPPIQCCMDWNAPQLYSSREDCPTQNIVHRSNCRTSSYIGK
jgi:hypothetical protein